MSAVATAPDVSARNDVGQILDLDVNLIDVAENVRVDPGELEGLAASIKAEGLAQPVEAVGPHDDGRYRLVYGQRRLLATRLAGLPTIRAIVKSTSDIDAPGPRRAIVQLVENLQRSDLNDLEEAVGIREVLAADPSLTQAALAEKLGKSPSWVANSLRLLEAAPGVQELIRKGELTAGHVKPILGLPAAKQSELARAAVKNGYSAHEMERQAKYVREDASRQERDRARLQKVGASAVKALEKAASKDAVIVVRGAVVANAIKAAGWTNLDDVDPYSVQVVKTAGECGCNAWRVQYDTYNGDKATVNPCCVSEEHRATRMAEAQEQRAREDEERDAAASRAALTREHDRAGITAALAPVFEQLPAAVTRPLLWMLIHGDYSIERAFIEAMGGDVAKGLWHVLPRLDDNVVRAELGRVFAAKVLLTGYQATEVEPVRDAILMGLGVPEAPPPAPVAAPKPKVKGLPKASVAPAGGSVLDDMPDAVEMARKAVSA